MMILMMLEMMIMLWKVMNYPMKLNLKGFKKKIVCIYSIYEYIYINSFIPLFSFEFEANSSFFLLEKE